MKVVEHDTQVLRLEDRAILLRVLGGIFAMTGLSVLLFPNVWSGTSWLVGLGAIVVGAALAILPRNTFIRFDRRAGTMVLERVGHVLPTFRREVRLEEIERVEVEQSDSGSDATYRVRVLVRNAEPLPFTEYSSSGEDASYRIWQRVFGWLKGMHG